MSIEQGIYRGIGAATEAKQDTLNSVVATEETLQAVAGLVVDGYDYIALTYVAAGNGVGEVETAIFKSGGSGGTTVATLTLAYNADNKLSSATKS